MLRIGHLFSAAGIAAAVACAQHRVPAPAGPVDEPRASWMIRAGDTAYEREICRSGSNQACVVQATSPNRPVSVVIAVYLFPAGGVETTYHGAFLADFVSGTTSRGHEAKVDYKIAPGRPPTAVTVAGVGTSRPGRYALRMALFAEVPGHTDPHQFTAMIPVQVVATGSPRDAAGRLSRCRCHGHDGLLDAGDAIDEHAGDAEHGNARPRRVRAVSEHWTVVDGRDMERGRDGVPRS